MRRIRVLRIDHNELAAVPTLGRPEPKRKRTAAVANTYWTLPEAITWTQTGTPSPGWLGVTAAMFGNSAVAPGEAWGKIHGALVTGAITATDPDGRPVPAAYWARRSGLASVRGDTAQVLAAAVRGLSEACPEPKPAAVPAKRKGHGLDFREQDAVLAIEMAALIKSGAEPSPWAAAWRIVNRAPGRGTNESKVERLCRAFKRISADTNR